VIQKEAQKVASKGPKPNSRALTAAKSGPISTFFTQSGNPAPSHKKLHTVSRFWLFYATFAGSG